jgi:CRISPR-associated endonuclease/helicase Cas3
VIKSAAYLWAKTQREKGNGWHPLPLHVLDVAASADAILMREPEVTRQRMAEILGMEWTLARPWLLLLIACHDLGKASPGFQVKWDGSVRTCWFTDFSRG